MKYQLDIQFFGGRGQYLIPPRRGGGGRNGEPGSTTAVFVQFPSLKEALGTKKSAMSISQSADGANPFFDRRQEPYAINCQRCVVAYELRRRGYDVIAQPNPNDKWARLKKGKDGNLYSLWRGAFRNAKSENMLKRNASTSIDSIEAKMKEYGNGSRAVVEFLRSRGGGHVVNVENRNGKVVFVEAQTETGSGGHIYSKRELIEQMTNKPRHVALTRTDNLQISYRASQFVDKKKHIRGY